MSSSSYKYGSPLNDALFNGNYHDAYSLIVKHIQNMQALQNAPTNTTTTTPASSNAVNHSSSNSTPSPSAPASATSSPSSSTTLTSCGSSASNSSVSYSNLISRRLFSSHVPNYSPSSPSFLYASYGVNGSFSIHFCAQAGFYTLLQLLIEQCQMNPNALNAAGESALFFAIVIPRAQILKTSNESVDRVKCAQILLKHGACLQLPNPSKLSTAPCNFSSYINLALNECNVPLTLALLDAVANELAKNSTGSAAKAASEYLLERSRSLDDQQQQTFGMHALHLAAARGFHQIVEKICAIVKTICNEKELGEYINSVSGCLHCLSLTTPMSTLQLSHCSCGSRCIPHKSSLALTLIRQFRANSNAANNRKPTLSILSSQITQTPANSNPQIDFRLSALILLKYGATANEDDGNSASDYGAYVNDALYGGDRQLAKALLDSYLNRPSSPKSFAELSARCRFAVNGSNILHFASQSGASEIIDMLVTTFADTFVFLSQANDQGKTPLEYAQAEANKSEGTRAEDFKKTIDIIRKYTESKNETAGKSAEPEEKSNPAGMMEEDGFVSIQKSAMESSLVLPAVKDSAPAIQKKLDSVKEPGKGKGDDGEGALNVRMELGNIDENAFAISPSVSKTAIKAAVIGLKSGKDDEKDSEAEWIVVDEKPN